MSHDLVGAQHLCVNHREDNLGETGGNRMQRLEGCALSIWTLSCEWWWAAKRFWSGEWHALEGRDTDKSGGLCNIQGKTEGYGDEKFIYLKHQHKTFSDPISSSSTFCLHHPTAVFLVLVSYFIFISSCALSTCLQYKVMLCISHCWFCSSSRGKCPELDAF